MARAAAASVAAVALLRLPQPYDFALSTERFRAFGPDLANLWHEGGLHRVVAAREVSLYAAFAIRNRLIERFGARAGQAYAFPSRERLAAAGEEELVALG